MSEYQNLENEILSEFKNENLQAEEENLNKIEELVDEFNIYWKNYQDKWNQDYWQIYESLLGSKLNNINENEISDIYSDKDHENIIFCNDSILLDDLDEDFKDDLNVNKDKSRKFFNNDANSKDNQKFNSTDLQTKTLINLHEIDAELDKINDVSMIKDIKEHEKRRNCFDCLVF